MNDKKWMSWYEALEWKWRKWMDVIAENKIQQHERTVWFEKYVWTELNIEIEAKWPWHWFCKMTWNDVKWNERNAMQEMSGIALNWCTWLSGEGSEKNGTSELTWINYANMIQLKWKKGDMNWMIQAIEEGNNEGAEEFWKHQWTKEALNILMPIQTPSKDCLYSWHCGVWWCHDVVRSSDHRRQYRQGVQQGSVCAGTINHDEPCILQPLVQGRGWYGNLLDCKCYGIEGTFHWLLFSTGAIVSGT